eukprot:gene157-4403_t
MQETPKSGEEFKIQKHLNTEDNITTVLGIHNNSTDNVVRKTLQFPNDSVLMSCIEKLKILFQLKNKNFAKFESCNIDRESSTITIETEYIVLDNVEDFIQSTLTNPYYKIIPEKVIINWLTEMCKILSVLHQHEIYPQNMIHEKNIFMNQKIIKVTDFGLNIITNICRNEKTKILMTKRSSINSKQNSKFKKIKYDVKKIGFLVLKLMTCAKSNRLNVKNIDSFDDFPQAEELLKRLPKVYGKDLKELIEKMISNKIEDIPYPEDIIQIKWNRNLNSKFDLENNPTMIVSKSIFSKYKTIQSAIKKSKINDIILVEEGIYIENIIIDKNIYLVSKGNTIIEGSIYFKNEGIKLSGFTIRNKKDKETIKIENSMVQISNCEITSKNGNGILLRGNETDSIIKNNHIHSCFENGIQISMNSKCVIFKNDIYDNQKNGIEIWNNDSNGSIKQNKIYSNGQNGIIGHSGGGSKGKIKSNDIFQNGKHGILINGIIDQQEFETKNESNLNIRENYIRNNMYSGISLKNILGGRIYHNLIFENEKQGIILNQSTSSIDENHIHSNKLGGLYIEEYSKNIISDNQIYYNNNNGFVITNYSIPILYNNIIHSNIGCGIFILNHGSGNIQKNNIYSNQNQGIVIESSNKSLIKDNTLSDIKTTGILVLKGGYCDIVKNKIDNCGKNGIEIRNENSEVNFIENLISNCGGCGINVYDYAECTLKKNEIFKSNFDNLQIWNHGRCKLISDNQLHHSRGKGINVFDGGILQADLAKNRSWGNGEEDKIIDNGGTFIMHF